MSRRAWAVVAAVLTSLGLLTAPAHAHHGPVHYQTEGTACTGNGGTFQWAADGFGLQTGARDQYIDCTWNAAAGDVLRFYGVKDHNARSVSIHLDGVLVETLVVGTQPTQDWSSLYYTTPALSAGSHTVRMVWAADSLVVVDYFTVEAGPDPAPAPAPAPEPSPTTSTSTTTEPTAEPTAAPAPSPEPSPSSSTTTTTTTTTAEPPPAVTVVRLDDAQFQRIEFVGGLLLFFAGSRAVIGMSVRRRG